MTTSPKTIDALPPARPLWARVVDHVRALRRGTLPREARDRFELVASALATGAAVLALGSAVHPPPRQLGKAFPKGDAFFAASTAEDPRAERPRVSPAVASAVGRGDLVALEQLYRPGMPMDGLLAVAAANGHEPTVRWLLDHGADVHEHEHSDEAALLAADPFPNLVALLLDRGEAEPSLTDAARAVAEHAVERQLARGVDPNPPGESPLTEVLGSGRGSFGTKARIAHRLLDVGATADKKAYGDADALTGAVMSCTENDPLEDCDRLAARLVERGAAASGDAIAAALGHPEPLRSALFRTVLSAPLPRGATAVALAKTWDPPLPFVKQLVAKGVDWGFREGEEDASLPLVAAVQRGDRAAVETLLQVGAPADRHFKNGASALGEAIDGLERSPTDEANIVEQLVMHGANVNRRLPDGRSPLFAAAETGDVRTIRFLLDHGAVVNERVLDDTPLDVAEQHGHVSAARVLHARGGQRSSAMGPRER